MPPSVLDFSSETLKTSLQPPSARPTIGFVSLGCPKNLVDSEVMMGLLHRAGGELTARAEDAEILVVNTCSFIDSAKQESVNTILEMAQHKVANGGKAQRLIVAGCSSRALPRRDPQEHPRGRRRGRHRRTGGDPGSGGSAYSAAGSCIVRTRRSTFSVSRAPSAVHQHSHPTEVGAQLYEIAHSKARKATCRERQGRFSREHWDGATAALPEYLYTDSTPRILTTPRSSAYIKIAEGCDHPCSFCIIPQLRGKFRSRRLESIVAEAENLIAQGVREITLIGQDTTCYGEDLGLKDGLSTLLESLAVLPGLKWLRFLYAYPNKITTRLLETIARHDNIAKYLDVPLQHASPSVLKRMKRGGTPDVFLRLIEKARATVPGIVLRTSFIVGFPGETDEDFQQLCDFVTAAKIDWLGVFSYSDEEGAAAFELDSTLKVPKRTIEARRRKLMKLQQKISAKAKRARGSAGKLRSWLKARARRPNCCGRDDDDAARSGDRRQGADQRLRSA